MTTVYRQSAPRASATQLDNTVNPFTKSFDMPPKKDRSRRATAESEEEEVGNTRNSGETGGELVPSYTPQQGNAFAPLPVLSEFSEEQVNSMIDLFQNMLHTTLQQFFPNSQNQPQALTPNPNPNPNSTPLPSIEISQASPPKDSPSHTNSAQLRAEEVGYFDPEYQQEQGTMNRPVVNAGKHVFYKNIYVFTDRLKDLTVQRRDEVKKVITSCFRGSALL